MEQAFATSVPRVLLGVKTRLQEAKATGVRGMEDAVKSLLVRVASVDYKRTTEFMQQELEVMK